ncbi:MAG: AzlD domain-containing protein [Treponema sp.]|nr:AzlD domain-containing protein [Treponema sp.]
MLSVHEALVTSFAMAGVIFFCRIFPFLFLRNRRGFMLKVLTFVEKAVPPVVMTVLTFNALADAPFSLALVAAVIFTTVIHIVKRNYLISIFGGCAVFMILNRFYA